MPVLLPNTVYDIEVNYHWQNANDRVAYQRAFASTDSNVERRIAQALLTANPQTANIEIQVNMNQPAMPPKFGYDMSERTIVDILEGELDDSRSHINDFHTTDFSGRQGAYEGTSMPAVVW
jgi:hypothetical protein